MRGHMLVCVCVCVCVCAQQERGKTHTHVKHTYKTHTHTKLQRGIDLVGYTGWRVKIRGLGESRSGTVEILS